MRASVLSGRAGVGFLDGCERRNAVIGITFVVAGESARGGGRLVGWEGISEPKSCRGNGHGS